MSRFIGLDVHKASCTAVVLNAAGKQLRTQVLDTQGPVLRDFLRSVKRPRYLCFEEGTWSQWLYELCEPLVDDVRVIQPAKRSGHKSDTVDAHGLAEAVRTGSLQGSCVFKASAGALSELRQAVRAHYYLQKDMVRAKNRLKAQCRARGIQTDGSALFAEASRTALLAQLPKHQRRTAELVAAELDVLSNTYTQAEAWLLKAAKAEPAVRLVASAPGIGLLRAAYIVAIVVTPHRFRTKRQFWSYAGFGIVTHSSSDWHKDTDGSWCKQRIALTRGLSRRRHPLLKAAFKGAAISVIHRMPQHPLTQHYQRLLQQGTRASLARLTIARRIAAAVLAIWKTKELYDPKRAQHTSR